MPFIGYHDEKTLPLRKGMTVTIPKGTVIKYRGETKTAGQTYKVAIHHVLPGQSTRGMHLSLKDMSRLKERGVDFTEYESLKEAAEIADFMYENDEMEKEESLEYYRKWSECFIHLSNPTIVWAGQGGYWHEVDINDVLPKEVVSA